VALGPVLVVLGAVLLGVGGVASVDTPGTTTPGGGNDATPKYDLTAKIGVEGTLNGARFDENSFRYSTKQSGWLSGASADIAVQAASFLGGKNVELDITLAGQPIDRSYTVTKHPNEGRVGASDSALVTFTAAKLPPGEYTLTYELFWTDDVFDSDGTAKHTETITVPDGDA
jgi:hypothetical protein